jgi:hypothetical protein
MAIPPAHHLTDRSLTPIISSSRTSTQLQALASLTHTSLNAYETVQRLGLGTPQRVMIEHANNGPVILQTFLTPHNPASTAERVSSGSSRLSNGPPTTMLHPGALAEDMSSTTAASASSLEPGRTLPDDVADGPPFLVGIVVASSADGTYEARRTAARLERLGRGVQKSWTDAQNAEHEADSGTHSNAG